MYSFASDLKYFSDRKTTLFCHVLTGCFRCGAAARRVVASVIISVEFYLYPTVGTVLIHSIKPELTE